MHINWTPEDTKRYQQLVETQTRESCRIFSLLAIGLFPLYGFLDYYAHRELFADLILNRILGVTLFILMFIYVVKRYATMNPYLVGFFSLTLVTVMVTHQCYVMGGFVSPYYAGVSIVLLAGILLFPVAPRQMFIFVTVNIAIYLLGGFLASGLSLSHPYDFSNNMSVLLANGVIGVVASMHREELRIESFNRLLQAEKSQSELEASKDLLQKNLQSEQDNVAALVREMTARQAEIERALGLREEFISLASHELKTPITSLSLQTQIFARRVVQNQDISKDQMLKLITTYDQQLKRLNRIISDMLDISRIQAGKFELETGKIDLELSIKQVVDLAMSIERTTINLVTEGQLIGTWDGFRLEQAVLNLLTNAIKYGRGRPIDISLRNIADRAHITVSDQGIGIRPENLERIFRRFERAVGATEFAGLGLGLYITKQIIDAHGGEIFVESEFGKGSTFKVVLPVT